MAINIDYLIDNKGLSEKSYLRFKKFYQKLYIRPLVVANSEETLIEKYMYQYCVHKSLNAHQKIPLKVTNNKKIDLNFQLDQVKDLELFLLKSNLIALIWAGHYQKSFIKSQASSEFMNLSSKVSRCKDKESLVMDIYQNERVTEIINSDPTLGNYDCFRYPRKDILTCTKLISLKKKRKV